jgi:hypothetical protein
MSASGRGIRQRQMLELMHRNGGTYPPEYRLRHATRTLLARMAQAGLIQWDGYMWRVNPE